MKFRIKFLSEGQAKANWSYHSQEVFNKYSHNSMTVVSPKKESEISDEELVDWSENLVASFNKRLRPYQTPRTLIAVQRLEWKDLYEDKS